MSYYHYLFPIIIGCVCVWIVHYVKSLIRYCKLGNEFPGNRANFFFGNLLEYNMDRELIFEYNVKAIKNKYPGGYRAWGSWYLSYVIVKAVDYEIILSSLKYLNKDYIYNFFYPWLDTGLLTSKDDKWHQRRKILTPAFHFNILRKYVKMFEYQTEKLLQVIEDECTKDKTNVESFMSMFTLNTICESVMGVRLDEENAIETKSYIEAIHGATQIIVDRVFNPIYYFDSLFWISPKGRQFYKYRNTMHAFCNRIIKEREQNFKDTDVLISEKDDDEEEKEEAGLCKKKKRFAMLDLMISAKRNSGEIDDAGIREEVNTFIFEGHDTTASALSFIIFSLANYKDVQDKVREEVDNIFDGSKRPPNYNDLQQMTYMDLVIKEALRLYPSVPFIGRTLWDEVPIRNGKYTTPKYSLVILFIYMLHRDPKVFENPEKFDPERFLPENSKNRNAYAYVPFSAGPRNCIGQKFALLQIKNVVSSIVRYYEIDPVDTPETISFQLHFILRSINGVHVKFRKRLFT